MFAPLITLVIERIYMDLGCTTEFLPLPGKRGILEFNEGAVDGEVFRLEVTEQFYTSPFIKSAQPFFYIPHSLWAHPKNPKGTKGYLSGVVWQNEYMKNEPNAVHFRSYSLMFTAYNQEKISAFLGNDVTVKSWIKTGKLTPAAIIGKPLRVPPFFHYLNPRYQKFLDTFSAYLAKHKPFEGFGHS